MRSRLKALGWILAAVGPLVLVWTVSHPRRLPIRIAAPAAMRAPAASAAAPPPPEAGDPVSVTGEVVDVDGRPVPRATVALVDPAGRGDVLSPGRSRELRDLETRTDDRGAFRFDGVPRARRLLVARPEGRPPAWTEPFLPEQDPHHVLKLPAPVSLTGLTHPGATLSFLCRIPGVPHAGHEPTTIVVVADGSGGYRAEGLPPAIPFAVRVEAVGYRPRSFGPYQFPSGRHILDFDLDTGLSLRGTVRDGAGRAVAGATVVYDDARAVTDADGSFLLAGLEERSTTLIVSRAGHITSAAHAVRPGSIEVMLPRAAEVAGTVIGGRGRYVCFTVGDARYRLGLGDSDAFRLPSVPPGSLRLDVEDDERRVLGSAVVEAPEGGSVEGVEILIR